LAVAQRYRRLAAPAVTEVVVRRLEFGVTGFYPAFEGADRARLSEEMGFDFYNFSENHTRTPDCFGEMRDAARATSRIRLSGGPVNFLTRNPGVVAAAILPLQILSGGRAICHVASGDSAVAAAGYKPQRLADLERDIGRLRTYLDGGAVEVGAMSSRLEWAKEFTWAPLPIQLACGGPRSIALAARAADRICLGVGANPERVAWALRIIEDELARVGRARDSVRVGLSVPLAMTADRASGRAVIRTRVAPYAHMQSRPGVDLAQQPAILRKVTSVLRDGYDYSFHHADAPVENPNTATCDEAFGDWMGIGGPPAYAVERLSELVELGLDFFMTSIPLPERELFVAQVMPALRKLSS
jgi:5,10-methylenetetrahydromethanopterin reductase